tara:strand:- start:4533 stop:4871 length:339 start_codon:yes stop_codon:yes gene_type:complete
MGDETPKKRGRPKKVKIDSISLSATDIDNAEIQDVIREALRTIVSDNKGIQKEEELIEAMVVTCSEFMKSFIIMGYDLNDNAIQPIFYANSDMEADALSHYVQQYFVSSMKK